MLILMDSMVESPKFEVQRFYFELSVVRIIGK